jgi:3-deoxy-D-manno-octulosonate 8-phosphate phosphatase (KDO 8-P phosphatase)
MVTAELVRRAAAVRLVLADNDGVLTDGCVWYSERGEELKRYSLRDGMGVELLREAGIAAGVVTREPGGPVIPRARKLGLHLWLGVKDKRAHLAQILRETNLTAEQVAFIGDDVNDLGLLRHLSEVGLTAAPADAMPAVLDVVQVRCRTGGGQGAFREFADLILELKNRRQP